MSRAAPALVQGEHVVQRPIGPAARQRGADQVGLGADQAEVEHARSGLSRRWRRPLLRRTGAAAAAADGRDLRLLARVLGHEGGDLLASAPVTMFWGMIAPEKPPLRMA